MVWEDILWVQPTKLLKTPDHPQILSELCGSLTDLFVCLPLLVSSSVMTREFSVTFPVQDGASGRLKSANRLWNAIADLFSFCVLQRIHQRCLGIPSLYRGHRRLWSNCYSFILHFSHRLNLECR